MEADEQNLLVLIEVRKMNRLQRENKKSIDEMSDQITYYQDLFDTVIANNRNANQSIVRDIRANLIRLSILANPKMRAMYRSGKKKSYIIESSDHRRLQITKNPVKILWNPKQQSKWYYLTSTGFRSIVYRYRFKEAKAMVEELMDIVKESNNG